LNNKTNFFEIFKKVQYRSLKHTNYFSIYDEIFEKFKDKKITLVEVGVTNGGSLMMWREYFKDNANIIGIDYNPAAKKWEKYGYKIFIGDQSNSNFWKSFFEEVGNIDILIDDGGHTNEQQLATFHSCYKHINKDGIMFFEDTHSSYLREFGNPSKYSFINFCHSLIDKQNKKSIEKNNLTYLSKIYKIQFYQSVVIFFFNEDKAKASSSIDNGGETINAEDYRLKDTKIFNFIDQIKIMVRKITSQKIYNLIKKIYPYFKFLIFKIKNRNNKKYFR